MIANLDMKNNYTLFVIAVYLGDSFCAWIEGSMQEICCHSYRDDTYFAIQALEGILRDTL